MAEGIYVLHVYEGPPIGAYATLAEALVCANQAARARYDQDQADGLIGFEITLLRLGVEPALMDRGGQAPMPLGQVLFDGEYPIFRMYADRYWEGEA